MLEQTAESLARTRLWGLDCAAEVKIWHSPRNVPTSLKAKVTEQLWDEYEVFATRDLSEYPLLYLFVDGVAERLHTGLSIRYTDRLADAGIEPSVGSVGDSYDNALAETIFGLYKTEVIRRRGPWRNLEEVEYAKLEWVDWFNHRRLFEPIGNIPPVEFEQLYYQCQEGPVMEPGLN